MSILTDKHFRIALLISVLTHGVVLSPLPAFRFSHPLPKNLRQMEIIYYYKIKQNPPEQEIIQAAPPISAEETDTAEIESVALVKKEALDQEAEEPIVKSKIKIEPIEPEEQKAIEEKAIAKVAEEKVATPEDIPREQKPLFLDYFQAVRERIKGSSVYPPGARRNLVEGITHLSFVLSRKGSLKEVIVKRSSGNSLLDQAAVQNIRDASPFPPFPLGLRQPQLRLSVQISYELN